MAKLTKIFNGQKSALAAEWRQVMRSPDDTLTLWALVIFGTLFLAYLVLFVLSLVNFLQTPVMSVTDGILHFDGLSIKDGIHGAAYGTCSAVCRCLIPGHVRRRLPRLKARFHFKTIQLAKH